MSQPTKLAVIGAIHVDRIAHAGRPILPDTSTPGEISGKPGGVAANIARALARLDCNPALIGCVGNDPDGLWVRKHLSATGIDVSTVKVLDGQRTGSYLALHQPDGSLHAAISDSEITQLIPKPVAGSLTPALEQAGIWLAETNMETEMLEAIAAAKGDRILAVDTVSSAKATRLLPILDKLDILFTNRLEASSLLGMDADAPAVDMAQALTAKGCKTIAITDGSRPLILSVDGKERVITPLPAEPKDVTGAGDAFIAGFLSAYSQGLAAEQAAYSGLAASAITVEATGAAPDSLSLSAIAQRLQSH
ncbi:MULTISPECIES: carbohydrate kinase family protein [Pseudovibrio]|uniref:carbohydrate kinase family protein n=1 Tax=Stappiaceae TaxID=2821832 RepID=UPI002365ED97|nr:MULTISPECIES: PfkB family carbohydrate kinase [Pseudovibrio]MDD7910457.1 PfkB family carbohydrate kinase [Pseudovibrio exalbescens]MDX5594172.1 PfkB family carbohydrate kinase [Pseudovibrio sp. SPO723]